MEKVVNWRGQPKMIPREGVVFFNAGDLNASFTKTFHFLRFPFSSGPSNEEWITLFEKEALKYKKSQGKMAVLVIDNVDQLPKDEASKKLLFEIQKKAKLAADNKWYQVIFVANQGPEAEFLMKNGESSKMEVVKIPELSAAESMEFLKNYSEEQNKFIIDHLTGGKLLLLQLFQQARNHPDLVQALSLFYLSLKMKAKLEIEI